MCVHVCVNKYVWTIGKGGQVRRQVICVHEWCLFVDKCHVSIRGQVICVHVSTSGVYLWTSVKCGRVRTMYGHKASVSHVVIAVYVGKSNMSTSSVYVWTSMCGPVCVDNRHVWTNVHRYVDKYVWQVIYVQK
jgi:hypothetical protein